MAQPPFDAQAYYDDRRSLFTDYSDEKIIFSAVEKLRALLSDSRFFTECPDQAQKELYEVYVILKILEERAQFRAAVQEHVSFDIVPRGRWL